MSLANQDPVASEPKHPSTKVLELQDDAKKIYVLRIFRIYSKTHVTPLKLFVWWNFHETSDK